MHSTIKVYLNVPPKPVAADLREAQEGFGFGCRTARGTVGGKGIGASLVSVGEGVEAFASDDDVHFARK